MPKILVSDKLGEEGVSLLRNHGEVDVKTAYIKGLDSFAIKMSPGFFDNPKIVPLR